MSGDELELAREINAARATDWAKAVAAAAPPLTDEQRQRIARIVLGGTEVVTRTNESRPSQTTSGLHNRTKVATNVRGAADSGGGR